MSPPKKSPPQQEPDKAGGSVSPAGGRGGRPDVGVDKETEKVSQVGGTRARDGAGGGKVVERAKFEPMQPEEIGKGVGNIESLMDVPMEVSVRLGQTILAIQQLLDMGPGSIIELDNVAGAAVDILVNNKVFAQGEVIVVDERFGVRITSLVSPGERIKRLGS